MFGGDPFPLAPDNTLTGLVVELMELDNAAVIQTAELEPNIEGVSREDVDQGPLVKVNGEFKMSASPCSIIHPPAVHLECQ